MIHRNKWRTYVYSFLLVLLALVIGCASEQSTSPEGKSSQVNFEIVFDRAGGHRGIAKTASVVRVEITVSGPGMDTITRQAPVTTSGTVTATLEIPKGNARVFKVEGFNEVNEAQYRGTTTQSIQQDAETVSVRVRLLFIRVVVNNLLLRAVDVDINSVFAGTVAAQSIREFQIPPVPKLKLEWFADPVSTSDGSPIGDDMSGLFPEITDPADKEDYEIDNKVGSDLYFFPVINNETVAALLMGVNMELQSENRCDCVVPPQTIGVQIGYYQWFSNSNVRAYREGSNYTGSYIYWEGFDSFIEPGHGRTLLRASVPPGALAEMTKAPMPDQQPRLVPARKSPENLHTDDSPHWSFSRPNRKTVKEFSLNRQAPMPSQ